MFSYPLDESDQYLLIKLKQHEWDKTDVDWLTSMRGDYGESLTTRVAIGLVEEIPAGTATVAYPAHSPEVCIIEDVVTLKPCRGLGIGAKLTDLMVEEAFGAGCRLAYLGNTPLSGSSVYERVGFKRITGAIMRRAAPGFDAYEETLYTTGQATRIRPTEWGDLPAFVCLMSRPMNCLVVDYPRGLVSSRHIAPVRAVSNFTSVRYETLDRNGVMMTLVGESPHRVLGFGSLTPGPPPLRHRTAVIDMAVDDNYSDKAREMISALLKKAHKLDIRLLEAYLAEEDNHKATWFIQMGFEEVALLPNHFFSRESAVNVSLLHYSFKNRVSKLKRNRPGSI